MCELSFLLFFCSFTVAQAGKTYPKLGPKYLLGGGRAGVYNARKPILCDDFGCQETASAYAYTVPLDVWKPILKLQFA